MLGDIAIAIVEGEANETPIVALLQPPYRFVEGDHVETGVLYLIEQPIEELRSHFEEAVRREVVRPARIGTDMVQGEDHPCALGVRSQQTVSARMIQARHGRLHHGGFHLGHGDTPLCTRKINLARAWF